MSLQSTFDALRDGHAKVTVSLVNGEKLDGAVVDQGTGYTTLLESGGHRVTIRTDHVVFVRPHKTV